MPFLKIPYRDYPKEGLFKNLYRENIYKIEEFKDEFKYYEYTPIEKIIIQKSIIQNGYYILLKVKVSILEFGFK